jgi:hypothetical protein
MELVADQRAAKAAARVPAVEQRDAESVDAPTARDTAND